MIKRNDFVKMKDGNIWVYGFVTIPNCTMNKNQISSKVLWEFPDTGLDYWYYNNKELIVISEEEYNKAKIIYNHNRID